MKPHPRTKSKSHLLLTLTATLLTWASTSSMVLAEDIIVHRFNTAATAANWTKWWGAAATTISHDANFDAAGNIASGSLKVVVDFNLATHGGDNQFAIRGALSGNGDLNALVVDASKYARVEFDLYCDPGTPMRPWGDYGGLDVGLVPTDFSQIWLTNYGVQVGWQHLSIPIDPAAGNLSSIGGLVFKMWSGDAGWGQTGTATFWLDNIKLIPIGFITDFDTDAYVAGGGFWNWWGGAARTVEWDSTKDADGDVASGAIKISVDFPGTGDNQYSQGMSLSGSGSYNSGVVIATPNFSRLEFDLLWDSASTLPVETLNDTGDPQGLGIGFASPTWGQTWAPNANQPRVVADGAWHTVSIPLDPSWPNIPGLVFKKWFGSGPTGSMVYWLDNVRFIPSSAAIPPPTMSLAKARKGLNLFASQPGGQYQRQGIQAVSADYVWWIGNPNPVTYSLTIVDTPPGPDFQTHVFLVPDGTGNAPDYSAPHAIMLDIRRQGESGGVALFRSKTNQPTGNSQMYNEGVLASLSDTTIAGTWSLRFVNDTNVTITGPTGVSTNFTMHPEAAALFMPLFNMYTIFGVQPNQAASIGGASVISRIRITNGDLTVVDDTFPEETLSADWENRLDSPQGLFVVTEEPAYWISWTLPDADFTLQQAHKLGDAFADSTLTPLLNGTRRHVLLRKPEVLDQSYFLLQKPAP